MNGKRYRYGFNGKEKDNETYGEGNAYDFGARIYDSRLGRWLSLDPLMLDYASLSPYIFAGSSPITFYDAQGRVIVIYYKDKNGTTQEYKYTPGIKPSVNGVDIKNDFLEAVHSAISYNMNTEIGAKVWNDLSNADGVLTISELQATTGQSTDKFTGGGTSKFNSGKNGDKSLDGKNHIGNINWDHNSYTQFTDDHVNAEGLDQSVCGYMGVIPPSTALIHEAGHAQRYALAQKSGIVELRKYQDDLDEEVPNFGNKEEKRVIVEIEHLYVRQINAFEQSKATNPQFQPIRPNYYATVEFSNNSANVNKVPLTNGAYERYKECYNKKCGSPATDDGTTKQ